MSKAKELMDAAFSVAREPRSPEYKAGVLDVLMFRLGEAKTVKCPFEVGTASADAYFAGGIEGHQIFRVYSGPAETN